MPAGGTESGLAPQSLRAEGQGTGLRGEEGRAPGWPWRRDRVLAPCVPLCGLGESSVPSGPPPLRSLPPRPQAGVRCTAAGSVIATLAVSPVSASRMSSDVGCQALGMKPRQPAHKDRQPGQPRPAGAEGRTLLPRPRAKDLCPPPPPHYCTRRLRHRPGAGSREQQGGRSCPWPKAGLDTWRPSSHCPHSQA